MDISLKGAKAVRNLCIYRPPDESAYALFYEEFSRLLEHILAGWSGDLLIAGDFNFHLVDLNNRHAKQFVDMYWMALVFSSMLRDRLIKKAIHLTSS